MHVHMQNRHAQQLRCHGAQSTWNSGAVPPTHCSSPRRGPRGVMAKGVADRDCRAAAGAAASTPLAARSTCISRSSMRMSSRPCGPYN